MNVFSRGNFAKIRSTHSFLLSVCFACNLANGPVVSSAVAVVVLVVVGGAVAAGGWRKEDSAWKRPFSKI